MQELYKWSSCVFYLDSITTPMVFINALDDPLVPEMLLNPIKSHAGKYLNMQFVYKRKSVISKNVIMSLVFFNFSKSLKHVICGISSWRSPRFLRRRFSVSKSYNVAGSNSRVPRRIFDFSACGQSSQSLITQFNSVNLFVLSDVDRQRVTHTHSDLVRSSTTHMVYI